MESKFQSYRKIEILLMKMVYCKEWSLFLKQPHCIINESEAKDKHKNGKSYVVVIYEEEIIVNVIGINETSLTVRFYNENQEDYLLYGFVKKVDKLFLNMACHYLYDNGEKVEMTLFNFKETGELFMERRNKASGKVEQREAIVDVTCNWEEIPKFGQYQEVIKVEREN